MKLSFGKDLDSQWAEIRGKRDIWLGRSDSYMMPDRPITDEQRSEVLTFRESLRNLTNVSTPFDVVWPTIPTFMNNIDIINQYVLTKKS